MVLTCSYDELMFERFTARARRSLVLAQAEAPRAIEPVHLLLGLIEENEGVAALVLRRHEVSREGVLSYARQRYGEKVETAGRPPFSPRAKKCLELSLREALRLGHNYIGTEHILLGIIREAGDDVGELEEVLGTDPVRIRQAVEELKGEAALGQKIGFGSPAVNAALSRARELRLAEQGPLTTGHLLAAMVADEGSMAAVALGRLGVTTETLETELAAIDVATTSDATPLPEPVEVRIGDEIVVRIDSPGVAAALRDLTPEEIRRLLLSGTARRKGRRPPRAS